MPIVYTGLPLVLSEFPDHKDKIKRLFRENETFQSLCEDYRKCSKALKYWKQSAAGEAPARSEEYRTLLSDLVEEILQNINELR